jgi:hypothetical protein
MTPADAPADSPSVTNLNLMPGMTSTNAAGPAAAIADPDKIVWVCPMPEHVSIEYDRAGKCPICGMTLVPVTRSVLRKIQPGGQVLYYTCPMPEHDIHSDKPGKCPKCGMTLIPVMSLPGQTVPPVASPMPVNP